MPLTIQTISKPASVTIFLTMGTADFAPFAEFGSQQGLNASDVFETSFRKTLRTLEAIPVDGRAERDVLSEP